MLNHRFGALLAPTLALSVATAAAQEGLGSAGSSAAAGWNTERSLELVQRAQLLRAQTQRDTALFSYQSDARGYVYFYLDREDTGERNLVKTDQVALEVFWRAPDLVKQRIVGWRDDKRLPTNIQYHIDHLAVVHDNFGDLIRIGDGDEVRDVLHPAAPGAETYYEYRLVDSLTLRLPGTPEPIRVYEVNVRPRDLGSPALIGSIFVDRRSGALVRMDFTFTPASYVDPNLDYINISLDNGLWMGRYWLPNQQRLELRRQIPQLDIPAGSIIRGTMRVGNYRFNEEIPDRLFWGPQITVAPQSEREAFPFEEDIYAELRAEGIGPATELREIRRQALQLARQRSLSGMPGTRLRIGTASEVLRYNRAEALALSLGVSHSLGATTTASARGGWAFGPAHPLARAELRWRATALDLGVAGQLNTPRDLGGAPVVSGAINTLSALFAGADYLDPYYASGGELWMRWRATPRWWLDGRVRHEEHSSARRETDFSIFGGDPFRAVPAIDEGRMSAAALTLQRLVPAEARTWWSGSLGLEGGFLAPSTGDAGFDAERRDFARLRADLGWGRHWTANAAALELRGAGGFARGELPRQDVFVLGGRGTIPGYDFRAFGGDRFAHANLTVSADLAPPWLRGRLLAAAGWAEAAGPAQRAVSLLGISPTDGVRPSLGAGLGIFFDILRFDAVRGFGPDGRWEFILETRRSFWDFL
jgi:hypothetical protein